MLYDDALNHAPITQAGIVPPASPTEGPKGLHSHQIPDVWPGLPNIQPPPTTTRQSPGFYSLQAKKMERLESILMPANFSRIVGEFVGAAIPKFHPKLVRNRYPNGHPDLIPVGLYPDEKIKVATEGIEVKGSQPLPGWQGHNPEDTWLMVFVFESNKPQDKLTEREPKPFRFRLVVGAKVTKADWKFSGRSETSRRTITASIRKSGYEKMFQNWINKATD